MKAFFIKAFIILTLSVALYSTLIILSGLLGISNWTPNTKTNTGGYGQALLRFNEAEKASNIDLLVIGSSHAYRGFDPRIFKREGINMFNLGSSAQTPMNSYYLLKEHLPIMKPKYVILEAFWGPFMSEGEEPTVDLISNNDLNINMLKMVLHNKNALVLNCLFSNFLYRFITPLEKAQQIEHSDLYVSGGYSQTKLTTNKLSTEELLNLNEISININDTQVEYLRKILNLCKENNAELLIVLAPVTEDYFNKVANFSYYNNLLTNISNEHHVKYINYVNNTELSLNTQKYFYDHHHLTQAGVTKYNSLLIKELIKKGIIKIH